MLSVNRFTVCGHVGSVTAFNKSTKLNVATNRSWTDEQGIKQEATDWVQLSLLDEKQAKWAAETVKNGDTVFAECRVSNGSYTRGDETIYTTDIVPYLLNHFPKSS